MLKCEYSCKAMCETCIYYTFDGDPFYAMNGTCDLGHESTTRWSSCNSFTCGFAKRDQITRKKKEAKS